MSICAYVRFMQTPKYLASLPKFPQQRNPAVKAVIYALVQIDLPLLALHRKGAREIFTDQQ